MRCAKLVGVLLAVIRYAKLAPIVAVAVVSLLMTGADEVTDTAIARITTTLVPVP